MKFSSSSSKNPEAEKLDLVVYGVFDDDKIDKKAASEGFKAKAGQIYYDHTKALLGLGEEKKATPDIYRKAGAWAYKLAQDKQAAKVGLCLPVKASIKAACEGAALAPYKFDKYVTEKPELYVKEFVFFTQDKNASRE